MCKHTSSTARGSGKQAVERHRPQSVPQPQLENSSMTLPKMSTHTKENAEENEISSGASNLLLPSSSNSGHIGNCSNEDEHDRAGGQEINCASKLMVKDPADMLLLHSWPAPAFPSDGNAVLLNNADAFCDASCSKGAKAPLWSIVEEKNNCDFYSSDEYRRRISTSTPDIPCGSEESLLPSSETTTPSHDKDGIVSKLCSNETSPVLLSAHKESEIDLIRFSPSGYSDCMDNDGDHFSQSKMSSRISSCIFHCEGEEGLSDDDGNNLTDDFDTLVTNNYNLTPVIMISRDNDSRQNAELGCDESTDLFFDTFFPKRFGLPQVKSAAEISVASSISQKSLPICRICHLPASEEDGLISPCRCAGTMQFIHNGCLLKWLEICSKRSKRPPSCELCLYQYHRHKKFRVKHWEFPQCSRRDKILHIIFIVSIAMMISCATATILCFKQDKGVRSNVDKTELTKSEVITLVCGVLFFIAFFVAMYVEVKSRNTLYKLMTSFLYLNQQWYIDEYDKKKDVQPMPV